MTGEVCNPFLFQTMMDKAKLEIDSSSDTLVAILIPGDFNMHGLAAKDTSVPNPNWQQMLDTFTYVTTTLGTMFPGVPVLSAVGNNDCYYHDSAPQVANATDYYTQLRQTMFETVDANSALLADPNFVDSWMQGGYYSTQLTDNLMLITLNGIYPFTSNDV